MSSNIVEEIDPILLDVDSLVAIRAVDSGGNVEYETPVKLEDPYQFDWTGMSPNQKPPTIERFIELTEQILKESQERAQILADKRIKMTEEYPLERFDRFGNEVITWRIMSRKPANLSTDGKSRPQKGYSFQYDLRSAKYPDRVLTVESRPLDHLIELSCWSKEARLANKRALWLERLMIDSTWIYQYHGFDRFVFEERLADTYYNVGGGPLYQRPLRFLVRLSEFRIKASPIIKNISIDLQKPDGLLSNPPLLS